MLYEALDIASLDPAARRRATAWIATTSSLFGLVRPHEPIPAYRLSGGTSLPGLGGVAAHWRKHLDPAVRAMAGTGLVIDLRSSTYASFWRPAADQAKRVVTMRVLQESDGKRSIVSHFNKATKGRIVRALVEDGGAPRTPGALADHLGALGWKVEAAGPNALDVIVTEV